jgi:hypothetical protein
MALSYAQLEGLWVNAGGSAGSAPLAAAIAMAESGGNPTSHNPVPPDDSYGLWQINMLGSMGPSRRKTYGLKSNTDLYDPATNARVAVAMSNKGTNFRPWSTFTNGMYKKFLNGSMPPDLTAPSPGPGTGGTGDGGVVQASVASDLGDFFANLGNWLYMITIIAGGALITVAGLIIIARHSSGASNLGEGIRVIGQVGKKAAGV